MVLGSLSRRGAARGPRHARQLPAIAAIGVVFALGFAAGATLAPGPVSRSVAQENASSSAQPPRLQPESITNFPAATRSVATVGSYRAEILSVVDGDTFDARVHIWPGLDVTTKVRLRGIDAPEFKARCGEERQRAEAARDALAGMLGEGGVTIGRVGLDKYGGRVLAEATTPAITNVSAALLAKGLVRPYDGGRRESWCGLASSD